MISCLNEILNNYEYILNNYFNKMVPIERTTHGQCVAPAIGAFFAL